MTRKSISALMAALLCFSCYGMEGRQADSTRNAIELAPLELFRATFNLSLEHALRPALSLNVSLSGTYGSIGGYGDRYLTAQEDYLSFSNDGYYYSPRMITGWGVEAQLRNYLAKNAYAPLGLYAAPYLSFREAWLISQGYNYEVYDAAQQPQDVTRELYIMAGGVLMGGRIGIIAKIFSIDFFAGAGLQLSKYADERKFTRYKNWTALDYSGVLPRAGLRIGILK